MQIQTHRSDPRILGRRTLERDHHRLAELLHSGFSVLDVGCGTGAITAGIARAVGPAGHVVGVDRDEGLLEIARNAHSAPNLRFELANATALSFRAQFDVVTAARTLQWIAQPGLAVTQMKLAATSGGRVVVLDYNHANNAWEPEPPPAFQQFYRAFLQWREANGWDNQMADHLPELFRSSGLADVESHPDDEIVERGAPDFGERSALWYEVIQSLGSQLAAAGFCTEILLEEAHASYVAWVQSDLLRQTLAMCTVVGRVA